MFAHLRHRILLTALFAVGLTLAACAPTGPNESNDQAAPERKLQPVRAQPEQKAVRQFQVRGATPEQLKARAQLRALRAR